MDFLDKLNSDKILVGYDLGNQFSQISYCPCGSTAPETISVVAGSENYNIPTVLCKRRGVSQWFYGREAIKYASENDGNLVENLVDLARAGEKILIEGQEFEPVALLTLFIRRSLSLLSQVTSPDKIGGIMFTCDELDKEMVEILSSIAMGLGLKNASVCFQGHVESVYYYNIYQPSPLWSQQVLVCEYQEDGIKIYRMECNKRTTPIVVFIQTEMHAFRSPLSLPEEDYLRQDAYRDMDEKFLQIVQEECEDRIVSSVYLLGEGFRGDWLRESLKFLCRNRRVFQGNNLFSKGACYSMMERYSASEAGKSHVFLGNEKLKSNVGMKVMRQGIDSYLALLDAGSNWFEVRKEVEFLLESGDSVEVMITPLNGRNITFVEIKLEGLPKRPDKCTRLYLQADMVSESRVQIRLEDLGFGEIFPASHMKWKEIFEV